MTSGTLLIGDMKLPYTLQRSAKRKRTIAFAVKSETSLHILAPLNTKVSVIESIVNRRAGWIIKKIADLKKHALHPKPQDYVSGEIFSFLGIPYQLQITRNDKVKMGCVLEDGVLTVNIHGDWFSAQTLREEVRFEIMSWYKKQARQRLIERTGFWQNQTNIHCRRVMISNPDRRWGSCSSDNDIRLNWRIIMAPLALIDYLIVHELCHVVQKNHSTRFWKQVEQIIPDYKERRRRLRQSEAAYRLD